MSKFVPLLLSLAIIIGIISRFFPLFSYSEFKYDQARESYVLKDMIQGEIILNGPVSSVGGFGLPPYYYYLLLPAGLISKNPAVQIVPNALLSLLTIPLLYYAISRYSVTGGYKGIKFLAAFSALAWSVFMPDVFINNRVWNPGMIPFFMVLYLILIQKLELSLNIKRFGLFTAIMLGMVMVFLSSLHAVTLFLIWPITLGYFYYRLVLSRYENNRLKTYLTVIGVGFCMLLPYIFASNSIFKFWYQKMFIEADYKVIYLSMSMVIAANIFVLINIFIKHSQIKWLLITFRKYFGWILSSVLVICFCINFEKIMLYPTTLIHIGYIPSDIGNFKIIYTITAAILVIATALMFSRFNVIGKLYSLYFFALIFIAQFFVNIYQFHYIILIWLFPLITGLPLLGSLFNRFRLGIWAATSLLLISILLNSQFLWNYLTHMKFGKERLVNLDDFIEMFAQLPENAYVDPGEDLEYVLAHKYVIEELLIKKLDSTPYCSLKGYIVQPKYLPASGYTTVKSAFTGFNKLQIIKENESYKLYYYEN